MMPCLSNDYNKILFIKEWHRNPFLSLRVSLQIFLRRVYSILECKRETDPCLLVHAPKKARTAISLQCITEAQAVTCYLSRGLSRKLDRKWRSQGSDCCSGIGSRWWLYPHNAGPWIYNPVTFLSNPETWICLTKISTALAKPGNNTHCQFSRHQTS